MSDTRARFSITLCAALLSLAPAPLFAQALAAPNDNRTPGGRLVDGVLDLRLVAQYAGFRPDLGVDSAATVQAFGETAGRPQVPGPLLRTESGTEVRVAITNDIADSTLIVHGLRAGTVADDTIRVTPGTTREIRFRAGEPGTYLYWGTTTGLMKIDERTARDGQLTGAIVIDPVGSVPDAAERIFVMTVIDIIPDTTKPAPHYDIWELAINGRAWPHSERLTYDVGETVRWRWLNGSYLSHPMHLHGFHFRVTAKGDGARHARYEDHDVRDAVTEFMDPGSTFAMEWIPTRAGNWLFHCHMTPHITPYPARPDSARMHDLHDVGQHAVQGMAGLVLGIHTVERGAPRGVSHVQSAAHVTPAQHLRLMAKQGPPAERPDLRPSGFLLDQPSTATGFRYDISADVRGNAAQALPRVPGPPLILTRGETTAITVVNRTDELTTVHWHGMELESIYDGVAGWSGAASNLAPLVAPGDSFTVSFTPPRSGTFMYHSHMDEAPQLLTGSYGPLIVLEPGERFDPATDLVFMVGGAVDDTAQGGVATPANVPAINGRYRPAPMTLRVGTTYRFRIINILFAPPLAVSLTADSTVQTWLPISKDGADVPAAHRVPSPAAIRAVGVGETYDFLWTPDRPMDAVLTAANEFDGFELRQVLRVR